MGNWKTPDDLKYTKSDEWVRLEGDTVTIGITDYAQDQLNDIVYVELPGVGDTLEAGNALGIVESVKAASDIYTPLAGEIAAINEELEDNPELINTDPFGKGWLIKLKVRDAAPLAAMMDAAAYATYCEDRDH
jgi:glycine cleavage system H protein